ncbi:MAG TPA: ABC transporter permease [Candidatus Limnocylindrales bacterium]|nr:ABC transporter permease [Candidatus Limnocylindrales bacterium]
MAAAVAAAPSVDIEGRAPGRRRIALAWVVIVLAIVLVWEGAKWLFGDPWQIQTSLLGLPINIDHVPPFRARIATDLSLPHVWSVIGAFILPAQRNGPPLGLILAGQALFTFREAIIGFAFGAALGLLLGIGFVHSRLAERAFVPYVVASQTVPILAISPLIVVATKAGWVSVAIISAYLTFFPVTIAALRGLRAADPHAFELMRSYAASRRAVLWKLRLPTSVPYLFGSLRVAAASAVIGAIVGELPAGIPDGLGSALLNYNQYYSQGPERLWATLITCSIVGLGAVGLVRLAEDRLTRNRYRPLAAS